MSSMAQSMGTITEKEYLEGEKLSDTKHEYINGYIYAMAGDSKRHGVIAGNVFANMRTAARDTPYTAFISDMKVRTAETKSYYYPDVVVACDDDVDEYYLERPCLVIEVLSKSTEKLDRREKLLSYMKLATLKAYLLVEQGRPQVELFYRKDDGDWWVENFEGLDAVLKLPCPDMDLTLADIYEDISFNTADSNDL